MTICCYSGSGLGGIGSALPSLASRKQMTARMKRPKHLLGFGALRFELRFSLLRALLGMPCLFQAARSTEALNAEQDHREQSFFGL